MSGFADEFELRFTERLLALAEDASRRGVPPDLTVRAMLSAALAFARRFDTGASIAEQLQPVLDHLADDVGHAVAPLVQ